ncbi:hypothetical protein KUTeg_002495 [Tegillarca granosa]|uniref:Uncharacterized protein n=1 Tax=Tegillarca granosa TaxID=220873 RepID=A0ABQ9FYZ4_TEGGR|nr:hypothetical protein KUTeg_002495 [Tegillarca granosa]
MDLIEKSDHECVLFCDASSFGYCGHLSMSDEAFHDGTESSTNREVEAVHRVLKSNEVLCKGKKSINLRNNISQHLQKSGVTDNDLGKAYV